MIVYMGQFCVHTTDPGAFISHSWFVSPWTDCSRSCGRGVQKREVTCRRKIDANKYEPTTNCSNNTKPNIGSTMKYCNSISCDSDWDTEEGFKVSNSFFTQVHLPVRVLDFLCPFLRVTVSVVLYSLTPFSL